jgi:hypothetical protein
MLICMYVRVGEKSEVVRLGQEVGHETDSWTSFFILYKIELQTQICNFEYLHSKAFNFMCFQGVPNFLLD